MTPQYDVALADIMQGLRSWRLWSHLGWQEVKRRYRRTVIGPFWTTISLGIFIVSLGFIWAQLWGQNPRAFLPYLCAGMVIWTMIATIITEGCNTFTAAEALIKQLQFPYSLLSLSIVYRNLIVFAHNVVIFVPVMIYSGIPINWNSLLILPGLALNCLTGLWVTLLLGILCTRFRDIMQIITSLLQISYFVTPIFFSPDQLTGSFATIVKFNFLYHYVVVVRSPMLGLAPSIASYEVTAAITILGWAFTLHQFARFRRRIAYWL